MADHISMRCKACPVEIAAGDKNVMRIQLGRVVKGAHGPRWESGPEGSIWGYIHNHCFLLAIGSPEGVALAMQTPKSPRRRRPQTAHQRPS